MAVPGRWPPWPIGLGLSIVTDVCLTGTERLACIPLEDYFPRRSYGIVLRRGKFLSPQAKRFIDVLRGHFAGQDMEPLHREPHRSVSDEAAWDDAMLG